MRKTAKRIVSAVIAVATVMTVALTASAADYATDPGYSGATSQGVSSSTETVSTAVKDAVKEAVAGSDKSGTATVTVVSTNNLKVNAAVVKELAKNGDATLEIVSPKATISIDASKIKSVKSLNLSAKISNSANRSKIVIGKNNKSFGCEVQITLTQCKLSLAKLKNAHWYLDGEDMGQVTLNEKNQPVITLTKGGEVIVK